MIFWHLQFNDEIFSRSTKPDSINESRPRECQQCGKNYTPEDYSEKIDTDLIFAICFECFKIEQEEENRMFYDEIEYFDFEECDEFGEW